MDGRFEADYFDGRTAARHRVEVVVDAGSVLVRGGEVLHAYEVEQVRIESRVGNLPLRIVLPDGVVLVAAADDVAGVLPIPQAAGLAHRLESRIAVVLASLAGIAVAGWFGYHDGVPWLARKVAERIPPSLEAQIAYDGLKYLDRIAFRPSRLDAERQARLRAVLAELARPLGPAASGARLEFRDGGWIGANAFALPGGVVVMTDQLSKALPNEDHVAAVLSHELGHLEHRHGARAMLQSSIAGLASLALFGDASSVSGLAATIPTALVHTSYSRDFEREADAFAFRLLRSTGRSPRLMGEALVALESAERKRGEECRTPGAPPKPRRDEDDDFGVQYLSTHPRTGERAAAAERAANSP
jgi:Zn-dependent protease with chaperone function